MSSPVAPSIEIPASYSRRADERRIKGVNWRRVGRQPNTHRSSTYSVVWAHGDSYIKVSSPAAPPQWICDYCDVVIKTQGNGTTTNHRRHLRKQHHISFDLIEANNDDIDSDNDDGDHLSQAASRDSLRPSSQFAALYTTINVERFRLLFIRLFTHCQVSFSIVERPEFQELLLYIQPSIERYLVESHKTIGNWVIDEFKKGQVALKEVLARAKSRVHISFDIWTAPTGVPILGICGHFLDEQLQLRHPLLALRFLAGHHTGVAMAEVVREVMTEWGIVDKWGVCVSDNADNNDTTCKALVEALRPNEPTTARRARCFGHMVNLAAKAFIYGKNSEGFIAEAEQAMTLSNRDQLAVQQEMQLWRKRGSFGKFHNVVKHIRNSPLRRQKFEQLLMGFASPQIEVGVASVQSGVDGKLSIYSI